MIGTAVYSTVRQRSMLYKKEESPSSFHQATNVVSSIVTRSL